MAADGNFDQPSVDALIVDGKPSPSFSQWIFRIHAYVSGSRQSGVTADRPTKGLWFGRRYYDRTLNKPVYVSSVNPVVWRDAAGVIA